ncbi:MAG: methyltransferase domain-containing protein [Longimicrobiales bacterium]
MTSDEAKELIQGAVLDDAGRPVGPTWADLGSGSGTFTFALAELLGLRGWVAAVDREAAALDSLRQGLRSRAAPQGGADALAAVVPAVGDFKEPGSIPALEGRTLDGALFANALHFDPEPGRTLRQFAERLTPGGRLVVVEYQDRPPNPWVPHPLPVARLEEVAADEELGAPRVVGERPSSYGGVLYCAWLSGG